MNIWDTSDTFNIAAFAKGERHGLLNNDERKSLKKYALTTSVRIESIEKEYMLKDELLQSRGDIQAAFDIKAIRDTYIPDTVRKFIEQRHILSQENDLDTINEITRDFDRQIRILATATHDTFQILEREKRESISINEKFLQQRFPEASQKISELPSEIEDMLPAPKLVDEPKVVQALPRATPIQSRVKHGIELPKSSIDYDRVTLQNGSEYIEGLKIRARAGSIKTPINDNVPKKISTTSEFVEFFEKLPKDIDNIDVKRDGNNNIVRVYLGRGGGFTRQADIGENGAISCFVATQNRAGERGCKDISMREFLEKANNFLELFQEEKTALAALQDENIENKKQDKNLMKAFNNYFVGEKAAKKAENDFVLTLKTSTDKVKEAEKDTLQANREALANFKEIAKIIPKDINGIYIKRNILQDVVRIRVYKGSDPFPQYLTAKVTKNGIECTLEEDTAIGTQEVGTSSFKEWFTELKERIEWHAQQIEEQKSNVLSTKSSSIGRGR